MNNDAYEPTVKELVTMTETEEDLLFSIMVVENLVIEQHECPADENVLPVQLAAFRFLAELYCKQGYTEAAREVLKKAEPIFLRLIEWQSEPVNVQEVIPFINCYLFAGVVGKARRLARKVSYLAVEKMSFEDGDVAKHHYHLWILATLLQHINDYENDCKRRISKIRQLTERQADPVLVTDAGLEHSEFAYEVCQNTLLSIRYNTPDVA